jgi:hypothetical protein
MAVPFSIAELQEDLAASKAQFDKWAISRLNALEEAKVEHVDLMREADGESSLHCSFLPGLYVANSQRKSTKSRRRLGKS